MYKPSVYIHGADNIGWSIDSDRKQILSYLENQNQFQLTNKMSTAKIIHNIWWDILPAQRNTIRLLRKIIKAKTIVTACNYIDPSSYFFDRSKKFEEVSKIADAWLCPSKKQQKILENLGLHTYYFPFSLDMNLWLNNERLNKREACAKVGLEYEKIKDKIVIGSFQRDTDGSDLTIPKWQKDPDLLIDLLKSLPKDKYVLLLVGPRRHYVLKKCKENGIPYIYAGRETLEDDLLENAVPQNDMPFYYQLLDIYLVTSRSEGGPKAILEAIASKTLIMSTDVGIAEDFMNEEFIFNNKEDYCKKLHLLVQSGSFGSPSLINYVEGNYRIFISLVNPEKLKMNLLQIYNDLLK